CPAISNVVTITVTPIANGSVSTPTAAICQYNSGSVSFTATAGTAPFTIQLLITAPGGGTSTVTQTIATNGPVTIPVVPINSAPGTYTVALQSITDNRNCTRTTGLNNVTINVTTTPAITFAPAAPALCLGTPVNITASGAATFAWSPATGLSATTGATVTANPAITTKYIVTGNSNGCNGKDSVTVTVNPLPAKPVVAASTLAYCQNATGTALTATALTGHVLAWYNTFPLAGGSSIAPIPSTATAGTFTYYVTQTNTTTGCISDTAKIVVTITPAINGNTITANQTICAGTIAAPLTGGTLTGGTSTYAIQWQQSSDGGITWNNIAAGTGAGYNPGILPAGVFQFRRSITSGLCNSTSNAVTLTVQANLTNYELSSGNQVVCAGAPVANIVGQNPLGGSGNTYTYTWEQSTDSLAWTTVAGATLIDYQPPAATTTVYYRRVTAGGLCPATSAPVKITVNPTPNGTITGPSAICSYDTAAVVFTASAGTAPYTVQLTMTGPGGVSTLTQAINSAAPVNIPILPRGSAAGPYTVQVTNITDSKGCSKTTGFTPVAITITAKPNLTVLASASTICERTSTTLTANGATTYSWSPVAGLSVTTGNTITATPLLNTTYTVIGTTNGCLDTATAAISVVALPAKPTVTPSINYCLNAAAAPLRAAAGTGNVITWYTTYPLTAGSATAPTPSTAAAGTYVYYVTQTNSSNCVSDTSTITVIVRPLPVAAFTLPPGICMPNGIARFTNNSTIADNSALTYAWIFGDGTGTSSAKDPSYSYAASGSYDVILKVNSPFGCTTSDTMTLSSFFEKPVARFNVNPLELCQGQNSFFTDESDPRGSSITKWEWMMGDGKTFATKSPTYRYTKAGTFTVKLVVTTAIGCVSDTFPQDVIVHVQPRIDAGPSFVVPLGTNVTLQATANDTTVGLYWTPPFGLSDPTKLRPTLTATGNQTYTLTATGAFNCTASDTVTVRILKPVEVPNAFSPNGDGTNDSWLIPNLADYPGAKVEIYNRWGQQVFLSYGYNRPWDGTMLGKPLPLATYYYIITLNNGFKPVTGSVTIIK
ncbi:MAG TPA: PKD domain-containing protein, partial [Flavisolibacter sp.]|nr:PKD domain-containing protein [Flavisolibacter sp.]